MLYRGLNYSRVYESVVDLLLDVYKDVIILLKFQVYANSDIYD